MPPASSAFSNGEQVGFTRTLSDGHAQSYLADVDVLTEHRGRGLGVELVRFSVAPEDEVVPPHLQRA
ncbi:MAG: GNAT family N-acetyltransferase [Gaiellaceae bacterium]